MNYWGTDKVEPHGYFPSYVRLAGIIGPSGRVCEIGVQDGKSLRMFQGLFPLGEITGVDNNRYAFWPEGTKKIVQDQDDPRLPDMLNPPYDLIVDDASHNGDLTWVTFERLYPLVKPGGFYVVEDWELGLRNEPGWGASMLKCAQKFLPLMLHPWSSTESVEYRYGLIIVRKHSG